MAGGGMNCLPHAPGSEVHGHARDIEGGRIEIAGVVQQPVSLSDSTGVNSSVRPGRVRNRTKTELDEKLKKPADSIRKKSPPARKAPARGRYVDEYARPAF